MIRRQLNQLDIHDLNFTVAELSPFRFELHDVCWGEPANPFLYLSSVKVQYTPKGVYAGRVHKVVVGRFESSLLFDDENRPHSELMDRVQLVALRIKQAYPPGAGASQRPLVLPEFELERGTVNLQGTGGSPVEGQVGFDLRLGEGAGGMNLKGRFDLPKGRKVSFEGRIELLSLDIISSVSASIAVSLDLSGLVDPAVGLKPEMVDLTGAFSVNGLKEGMPEWTLKLQIPMQPYRAANDRFSLSANLAGESEFHGSITNLSASGGLFMDDVCCHVAGRPEIPVLSNWVERISFDFNLPDTALEQLATAKLGGCLGVCNWSLPAGALAELDKGCLDIPFDLSATQGVELGKPDWGWMKLRLGELLIKPGELRLAVSNEVVHLATSLMVADELLRVMIDCDVPLKAPQSGTLKIEVPPVRLDNSSRFGKLARKKTGESFDFSGTLSALVNVAGLYPGASMTGVVQVTEGSYRKDKVELSGISMWMPLRFDGAVQSAGEPVLRIETLKAGNIQMGPGKILFQLTDRELFVERAQMAWAKGFLHAYAIHAGFDGNIRNEFVVYADKVDLGEVFMLVMPFDGRMEGVLYGRFPVVLNKKRVELSGGYLYSLPDQGGLLKLNDPAQMESLLSRAGIPDDRERSLAHALSDLDLTAIRLDLVPGQGEESSLRIKLQGKSNYQKRPAPVNLNLNLNGELQQLLDLGIDLQNLK